MMDSAQLHLCLIDVLKNLNVSGVNQFGVHLIEEVALSASRHGFIPVQERGREKLDIRDQEKVRELFWSLVIEGVIMPGLNISNPSLPFFALTQYGRQVVTSPDPVPHDPDRYMEHVRDVATSLDRVAVFYIQEGLDCFQRGMYTASVVMLGVAVEKITVDLASAVEQSLTGTEATNLRNVIQRDRIAPIYDEMMKRLRPRIPKLPRELADGLEGHLDGVFAIIRTHRNMAGHPTGQKMDRLTAFGLFSSFPFYCKRACELMDHIRAYGFPQ